MRVMVAVTCVALFGAARICRAEETTGAADPAPRSSHGWTEPTSHDYSLLQKIGSRIRSIYLNLPGFWRVHNDQLKAPGAAPARGFLVRRPGRGVVAQPYSDPAAPKDNNVELGQLPRAVDNSELPYFPPIFNQGDLNSCTSVATTYYQLTHMVGLARGWDQRRGNPAQRFSPMWTFNLINSGNNLGAFQVSAYAALLAHGAATLKDMPYRGQTVPAVNYRRWPDNQAVWQDALDFRIDKFGMIQSYSVVGFLRDVRLLLTNGHVLTAATAIDAWNQEVIQDNPTRSADNPYVGEYICTAVGRDPGNHCITIVGYNDDIWVDLNHNGTVDPGETGALKIANSWGRGDWNKGFRWLAYSALYNPHDPADAETRQAALYGLQAFWISVAHDYDPSVVLEVDLPAAYREDYKLSAGTGSAATAPNFLFNHRGGKYNFAGQSRPGKGSAVLDFTDPVRRAGTDGQIYLELAAGGVPSAPPAAQLRDLLNGQIYPLTFSPNPPGRPGFHAPLPALAPRQANTLTVSVPSQFDFNGDGGFNVPLQIGQSDRTKHPLDVRVFSCNSSVLTPDDVHVESDAGGNQSLRITPPANTRGSCLLTVHVSDGWNTREAQVRVNMLGDRQTAPKVTILPPRRTGTTVTVPFRIQPPNNASFEDLGVFFDTPQIDQIEKYEFSGSGAERLLTVELRNDVPVDLAVSALSGRLFGTDRVHVDPVTY